MVNDLSAKDGPWSLRRSKGRSRCDCGSKIQHWTTFYPGDDPLDWHECVRCGWKRDDQGSLTGDPHKRNERRVLEQRETWGRFVRGEERAK